VPHICIAVDGPGEDHFNELLDALRAEGHEIHAASHVPGPWTPASPPRICIYTEGPDATALVDKHLRRWRKAGHTLLAEKGAPPYLHVPDELMERHPDHPLPQMKVPQPMRSRRS
jgi:hypothetical protein